MNILKEVAVADASVGTNIIEGHELSQRSHKRVLVGVGLVGGNSVGECYLEIRRGSETVMTVTNSATGLGLVRDNMLGTRVIIRPNDVISAVVKTAPTVNPILINLNFLP
jgi:hypothetical protein